MTRHAEDTNLTTTGQAMELIDAEGLLAAPLTTQLAYLDGSHTSEETHLDPGVYTSKGHALLVGTNQRNLAVVDLGGVIEVAGIDITNPDHLDAFAEYVQRLAATFRARSQRVSWIEALDQHALASPHATATAPKAARRTCAPASVVDVDLLDLIEAKP